MSVSINDLPPVRGKLSENADIAKGTWFRVGGVAEILFKPADADDLSEFLKNISPDLCVTILGLGSNMIVRDGGIRGVVVKFGREFAQISHDADNGIITAGAAALDMNVAKYGAIHGLGGIEFLSGIPGSVGGALRMNAGAYGTETKDVLVDCQVMTRSGEIKTYTPDDMHMTYRHNGLPEDVVFLSARFETVREDGDIIQSRIDDIREKRHDSQPIKEKTGGSTFANPDGHKAWELIDSVGGRGYAIGGARMSEKHCNFMINDGSATATDLENLGEEMRARVMDKHGIDLRWEIKRIGKAL